MLGLRQKIAQLLCIGFDGSDLGEAEELRYWLTRSDGLGFLIFFDYDLKKQTYDKNIKNFEQLKKLSCDIKQYYAQIHPKHPGIGLSIDVEGGRVDRLARIHEYEHLPSANLIANLSFEERHALWKKHAELLQSLHIDLNFAPVVDLELSPQDGIFGPLGRCFSNHASKVALLSMEYIDTLNHYGIYACLKHFPGHGSATADSHLDFVDVSASFSVDELKPYEVLISKPNLYFAIMTAHVINRRLDKDGIPATLSKTILTDILRNKLKYHGLIISDDLQMRAISKYYTRKDALLKTFLAGADVIIFGNQLGFDTPTEIIDDIELLVNEGLLDEHVIEQAYQRVLDFKKNRSLMLK
jgi:beta-N-acetylhexosaminidase